MKRAILNLRHYSRRTVAILLFALLVLGGCGYLAGPQLWAVHHLRKARQALDDGAYEVALTHLDKCLSTWPNDVQTRLLAARSHRLAGNDAEALAQLNTAKATGGDDPRIIFEAQLHDAAAGKLEQAESSLRGHIDANHPEKRYVREALIRGYLVRQRAEDAERLATAWIDESPNDWQPWFLRAVARSQRSRHLLSTAFDQAKSDYERSLELKPDHHLARLLLGNAHMMTGQFQNALPHLERYHCDKPDDWRGAVELANCRRALSQVDEARRTLDDWLAGHLGTIEVHLLRGQLAMDTGKPAEALDFFRRAEELDQRHEKAHFHLAEALRALGRLPEADDYERKWRIRRELTERLKELEQLAANEPTNVTARYEAGTVALRLDQESVGLRWFANALNLDPKHTLTHQALADHFERKGNREAAAFHRRLAGGEPPK